MYKRAFLFHMVVIIKFYKKKIAIYGAIKIIFLGMCVAYVVHIQKIKDIFVISYKQMM